MRGANGDGVDAEGATHALARVDPHSGSETIIGKTRTEKTGAIDFDPATGTLYGANGDQLAS